MIHRYTGIDLALESASRKAQIHPRPSPSKGDSDSKDLFNLKAVDGFVVVVICCYLFLHTVEYIYVY